MLPSIPPAKTAVTIDSTVTGWPVYAVQAALNGLRVALAPRGASWGALEEDGAFGVKTTDALKRFQTWAKIAADGRAGPTTQMTMCKLLDERVHALRSTVPQGLVRGLAEGEGGNYIAAVNHAVAGGVDCGIMQFRCYGPPFDKAPMQMAFDPLSAMLAAADSFSARAEFFAGQPGVKGRRDAIEFAKRLAVLAHNWPAGAADIARDGVLTRPGDPATWVASGTRFPDGHMVTTRIDWCEFYSLGGAHGEGRMTRYVTDWS